MLCFKNSRKFLLIILKLDHFSFLFPLKGLCPKLVLSKFYFSKVCCSLFNTLILSIKKFKSKLWNSIQSYNFSIFIISIILLNIEQRILYFLLCSFYTNSIHFNRRPVFTFYINLRIHIKRKRYCCSSLLIFRIKSIRLSDKLNISILS